MTSTQNLFSGIISAYQCYGVAKATRLIFLTLGVPKAGTLVGKDIYSNEYYENRRERWVIYNKWNHDPSQIPPQWHQWIHKMSDQVPGENMKNPFFTGKHLENLTGTRGAFKTFDTTRPKLQKWEPKLGQRQ